MDGKVVVQVYFGQNLASRVRFSNMLLDFAKIEVKAGQTVSSVKIKIPLTGLEMWSQRLGKYVVEAATYDIRVGQYVTLHPCKCAHAHLIPRTHHSRTAWHKHHHVCNLSRVQQHQCNRNEPSGTVQISPQVK